MSAKPDVRMTQEEIDAFVRANDCAFVGRFDEHGKLIARPYRYRVSGNGLALLGHDGMPEGTACAVIDSYPRYDAIVGALLRGDITNHPDGARLDIRRASGFDFKKAGK